MRWFRSNSTFGGGLALFALALQLVLSFDHIHPEDIYGNLPLGASLTLPSLPAGVPAQAQPSGQAAHHDDYCLICATSALLGNSVTATGPQLPLPIAVRTVERAVRVADLHVPQRRTPFQSRAPPQA